MSGNAPPARPDRSGIRRVNVGRNHTYTLDGVKADGVTTLIGKGLPKPALPNWSARCVAEYVADADEATLAALRALGREPMVKALKEVPWAQRDAAAARGTEVHTLAERLIMGEEVDVPEELAGHVKAAVDFMDDWKVRPIITEAVVGNRRWRYAGTFDLVADVPGRGRAIIDYKTSRSGIFPETALQLAAYRHADSFLSMGVELPMAELQIDCGLAVWLRADGYDVIPLNCDDSVFQSFLYVAQVARVADRMREWVGESLPRPAAVAA